MTRDADPAVLRFGLKMIAGRCPHCGSSRLWFPKRSVVIYRWRGRSVTFRCNDCTLQWTVTEHRISQTAAYVAATLPDDDPLLNGYKNTAAWFKVNEKRGRRRKPN